MSWRLLCDNHTFTVTHFSHNSLLKEESVHKNLMYNVCLRDAYLLMSQAMCKSLLLHTQILGPLPNKISKSINPKCRMLTASPELFLKDLFKLRHPMWREESLKERFRTLGKKSWTIHYKLGPSKETPFTLVCIAVLTVVFMILICPWCVSTKSSLQYKVLSKCEPSSISLQSPVSIASPKSGQSISLACKPNQLCFPLGASDFCTTSGCLRIQWERCKMRHPPS